MLLAPACTTNSDSQLQQCLFRIQMFAAALGMRKSLCNACLGYSLLFLQLPGSCSCVAAAGIAQDLV